MNLLDVIIVVVFLAVFTVGFFSGFGRILASLIAFFVGLVVSGMAYESLAEPIARIFTPIPPWLADLIAFFVVLLVVGGIILYALIWSFRVTPLRTRRVLELRGGFPGIFVVMLSAVILATVIVATLVQVLSWTGRQLPTAEASFSVSREIQDSPLASAALKLSPYIHDAAARWTPGGPSPILSPFEG